MKKTLVLKVDPHLPDKDTIAYAGQCIKQGGLVAFPTETVYGIAANICDDKAIERLYAIKKRPRTKPFTVHIADMDVLRTSGYEITPSARLLIEKWWPGPVTVIVPSGRAGTVGLRMPSNTVALDLIRAAGVPVVAPSANISGNRPPTDARGVLDELNGLIDLVIDAGPSAVGIESTVVDCSSPVAKIVREGAIAAAEIMDVIYGK